MASSKQQHLGRNGVSVYLIGVVVPNLQKSRCRCQVGDPGRRGGQQGGRGGVTDVPLPPRNGKGGVSLHRTGAVTSRVLPSCLTEPRPRPQLSVPLCPSCILLSLAFVILTCVSLPFPTTHPLNPRTMSGQMGSSLRLAAARSRAGSARLFSTQSCLRKEIRDAYILSASRTPTAKVGSACKLGPQCPSVV
jgi:hypothetical protein